MTADFPFPADTADVTEGDRVKAAEIAFSDEMFDHVDYRTGNLLTDRIAAALAAGRAAAVADLRARVEALADAVDGGAFGIPPARSVIAARLRDLAAVTDTTGGTQ